MTLQEQIKKDLAAAMRSKDAERKDALRVILGELGRAETKELTDREVVKILKKLLKNEKEVLEKRGQKQDSEFIRIVEAYLPRMATEQEIKAWIAENIDFSQLKNKMQAMRPIMQHFGERADGERVKQILQDM
ncbi:MAG: GatB/YqeY domain-containing protein [Deltaproteobacteria bacterium]|nr:GatB/YqeY domain-containing protein [Deltaproteobacteria bacterium]MBW1994044.1 GatB/YqeY domain-containing protein [Deltaproteobacteria bacterium]MBW2153588.1 GatB/YqeY domain-containing protein [Deltaproteobacteria bacterium]